MLPRSVQFRWILNRVFEEVFKNGFVFFVDHVRDGKVSLQPIDLLPKLGVHVRHVRPLLGLIEKVRKAELAASKESRQGNAVAFDRDVGLPDGGQVRRVAGAVQRTSQPV